MNHEKKRRSTEIKVGLSVLVVLFVCLVAVVVVKTNGFGEFPTAQIGGSSGDTIPIPSDSPLDTKPMRPTILASSDTTAPSRSSVAGIVPKVSEKVSDAARSTYHEKAEEAKLVSEPFSAQQHAPTLPSLSHKPLSHEHGETVSRYAPRSSADLGLAQNSAAATDQAEPWQAPRRQIARYGGDRNTDNRSAQTQQTPYATPRPFEPAPKGPTATTNGQVDNLQVKPMAVPAQNLAQYQETAQRPLARNTKLHNTGKTIVEPGDSMWTLSRRVYGSGAFFKAIQEHNRHRFANSHDLRIGDEVLTPDLTVLRKKYPGLCPRQRKRHPAASSMVTLSSRAQAGGRTYTVEEGDTLYDIARYELGAGSRWPEIYDLNRQRLGVDFDYLRPGIKLSLPADRKEQRQDAVTQLPRPIRR